MTDEAAARNLPTTTPEAAAEARTQADEYDSLFGTTDLEIEGGGVIKVPPHPDYGMLDDEQMQAYEEYLFEVDTEYDREPDVIIPEHRMKDDKGNETGPVIPSQTIRGALLRPYRKTGVLVRPPHSVRVAEIALGETDFKRLREGGRSSKDVWKIWGKQSLLIKERQQRDSKSVGSSVDLASVSPPNS